MASRSVGSSRSSAASVRLQSLAANQGLERRIVVGWSGAVERGGRRVATRPPDLVADAVHHGLTEVGLERAVRAVLEDPDLTQGRDHRFLHQVVGIHQVASPGRQAAVRPPFQGRTRADKDLVQGGLVPGASPFQQLHGAGRSRSSLVTGTPGAAFFAGIGHLLRGFYRDCPCLRSVLPGAVLRRVQEGPACADRTPGRAFS